MPRITEPTVAAHRAKQRAAVLRAAEEIAVERGGAAVTIAAVAARTGLARPSLYAYVGSAEEMLVELVRAAFARWDDALREATPDGAEPAEVVRGYLRAAAARAARGEHRLASALSGAPLPDAVREEVLAGHRASMAPLVAAVQRLGAPEGTDPEPVVALVMAVVNHCIARVEAGHDADAEAALATGVLLAGLHALGDAARS